MRWCPLEDPLLLRWDADRNPPVQHEETAPTKLTVNQPTKMWASGLLSSQEWSGPFTRYIAPAFDYAADQARQQSNWWTYAYILERLQHEQRIPANHLEALLAVRLHGLSWSLAFVRYACTAGQLGKAERAIIRHYLPRQRRAA